MVRKVNDLNKTAHKSKRKPVSKRRLQYLLHKAEVLSNQYKAERDTLIEDLKTLGKKHEALEANENSLWLSSREFECERDELAAKVSRLEREKEQLKESHIKHITNMENYYKDRVQELKEENKALRLQADTYFEQWQQHKALNNEFSQHIGNKPSSSTYKYFRAKLDGIGIKVGE